jgi:diaminopimelate decarboxylase
VSQSHSWPLRVTAHHPTGARKAGPLVAQDIAGPLCFAGDLIARARPLPALAAGDVVAILDTGAYCFSAPYHFNTLPEPAVYGVRTGPCGDVRFELLRPAQTIDDLLTGS